MALYLAIGRPSSPLMVRKGSSVRVRWWALGSRRPQRGGPWGPLPHAQGWGHRFESDGGLWIPADLKGGVHGGPSPMPKVGVIGSSPMVGFGFPRG
jgi:hypothetical protein